MTRLHAFQRPDARQLALIKALVFVACALPFALLVAGIFGVAGFGLGANPVEEMIHRMGLWGLRLLLVTLAVTPVRQLTGLHWLVRLRRMLGLFSFFYVVMHLTAYAVVDQRLAWGAIVEDIIERPYITVGMTAIVLMIPLAVTSTNGMMRRLGKNWQKLHRLVYVIAILGVWHFFWQVKKDITESAIYATILVVLLGYRWWRHRAKVDAGVALRRQHESA